MPHAGWVFWQLRSKAKADAPPEWRQLSTELLNVLPRDKVSKIELIAFVRKGSRVARWTLSPDDPDYCTPTEALRVAKKLSWLMLVSRDPPQVEGPLQGALSCTETVGCKLMDGHDGLCRTLGGWSFEPARCDLCGRRITFEDFDRDAQRDPQGISVAHRSPLSQVVRAHNPRNVSWAHRVCNQLQGEQSLDAALNQMRAILEFHGYVVSPSDRR